MVWGNVNRALFKFPCDAAFVGIEVGHEMKLQVGTNDDNPPDYLMNLSSQ